MKKKHSLYFYVYINIFSPQDEMEATDSRWSGASRRSWQLRSCTAHAPDKPVLVHLSPTGCSHLVQHGRPVLPPLRPSSLSGLPHASTKATAAPDVHSRSAATRQSTAHACGHHVYVQWRQSPRVILCED